MRWAIGIALLAFAYLSLITIEFAASVYASHSDLGQLQRAVWLSPGNADYRHRLATFLNFSVGDPQAAAESYRAAVALNPYDANYWLDLAGSDQVLGDTAGQRTALDHAIAAEPTAPAVAWNAANFFLVDGQIDRALQEFRVVIGNDTSLADAALKACWRVRPDADALLQEVVPPKLDPLFAFRELLAGKQETEGTIKTWDRIVQLHEKFDAPRLFAHIAYLLQAHRPDAAMSAWEQSAGILGLTSYLPTDDNLVVNGDFSLDVLNGGFDWTYTNRTGVKPILDASDFRQGHRSLSLTFEGPAINDAGIQQMIPVRGGTKYDFSAYYKSTDFEGAGGPVVVLHDAYTDAVLYASDALKDADFWKEVHSQITVPTTTTLLRLAIERLPAGSPIRGKLWLDDFHLTPDDSTESRDAR
jgi:tetratricopeptide (TPR) repeat protein